MAGSEFLEVQDNGLSIGLASPAPEFLLTPNIGVIGVGGAGGNAVNNMVMADLGEVSFFVANTDAQALSRSAVADKIQLGVTITQGLGAGANPEIGRASAEEAQEKIQEYLKGLHLLFITAGMGGGTGTGAAPVIARLAKEMGILTVGVVSKPFQFEGRKRMQTANNGIEELKKYVDTLIVIPNQNLFRIVASNVTFADAFRIADGVLCQGVRSITDLVINPGMINLDFSDVKTVLSAMGRAMMGTGEASGENRAEIAVEQAISNPLLDDSSIQGAKSILLNIAGGMDLTLAEVDFAAERVRQELDDDANIIFGTCVDEALHGKIRISVVATGIEAKNDEQYVSSHRTTAPIVDVVVQETPETVDVSSDEETQTPIQQDEFPLMNETTSEAGFETAQSFGMDLHNDISFSESENTYNMAIELTEAPISQPPLFDEEVPEIGPIIPIENVPEVRETVNMESKKADANVKVSRSSLFDLMLPGFMGKSGRREKEDKTSSGVQNEPANQRMTTEKVAASSSQPSSNNMDTTNTLFGDVPFENVDLPAFLRRR
ncbi:MAG: cell division protein FtsZ [Alphaproteobacteria bacterium]|nr:cell division protein FtsZ [Alphaproteobacteria bacterium]